MSNSIVSFDEEAVKSELRELVRKTIEETMNAMLDEEADQLVGAGVPAGTVSNLNDKAFKAVDEWRCRPLACEYPYVYVDGIYLERSWGGSYENVAVMVAIGMNEDGHREVIGCAEGFTESSECWRDFLSWLRSRGLRGVRMAVGDKAAAKGVRDGYTETLAYCEMPREHWRRIRTNNAIERLNGEIRRRTRVVGTFPDGKSALMLVAACLKYVADSEWGSRRYLDVSLLKEQSC